MRNFFNYLKSLIASNTGNSIKSFSLLVSIFVGFLIGLAIVFTLVWDVTHNDHLETDLNSLGFFIGCVGAYITGSSVPKIFGEKYASKQSEE